MPMSARERHETLAIYHFNRCFAKSQEQVERGNLPRLQQRVSRPDGGVEEFWSVMSRSAPTAKLPTRAEPYVVHLYRFGDGTYGMACDCQATTPYCWHRLHAARAHCGLISEPVLNHEQSLRVALVGLREVVPDVFPYAERAAINDDAVEHGLL